MSDKKVSIAKRIEQVVDGSEYKGDLQIGGVKFEYTFTFAVPIPQLDGINKSELPSDPKGIRNFLRIVVKRDDAEIEFSDQEYSFFLNILARFAIEFYNNPQTRASNQGILGDLMHGGGLGFLIGASASFSMSSEGVYTLSSDICERLSQPKFGCVFV